MNQWYDPACPIPQEDGNFRKILNFYLFECPVDRVSVRGVTLERLGWRGAGLTALLGRMKAAATGTLCYLPVSSGTDVGEAVAQAERSPALSDPDFELIAFREDQRLGKTRTILYRIRNALAHGSFSVTGSAGCRRKRQRPSAGV